MNPPLDRADPPVRASHLAIASGSGPANLASLGGNEYRPDGGH
jgi:hypothetical protein